VRAAVAAAAAAPASVKAERAGFLSVKKDTNEAMVDDLIGGVSGGRVDIAKVPAADLPASLAALPAEELKEQITKKAAARGALLDKIAKVSSERESYLKRTPAARPTGFDAEVQKTVEKAGKGAGLAF
jgi:hypothetical protein